MNPELDYAREQRIVGAAREMHRMLCDLSNFVAFGDKEGLERYVSEIVNPLLERIGCD